MKCVICEHEMDSKRIKNVEIDLCTHCGGVWLDGGEFERLSGIDPASYRKILCKECGTVMAPRTINGVEVDLCPNCGAVWLDNGELEKIVGLNPFGDFGKSEFELFREAVLMSREIEQFAKLEFGGRNGSDAAPPLIINDVFLIYKDGCLIVHKTRRLKPDMDDEVLSAMFIAIQKFIEDSFKDERTTELKRLSFGESEIIIERGNFTFMAAVVCGTIPDQFPMRVKQTVDEIEREYGTLLSNWNHEYNALRGAQDIIQKRLIEDG